MLNATIHIKTVGSKLFNGQNYTSTYTIPVFYAAAIVLTEKLTYVKPWSNLNHMWCWVSVL